MSYVRMAKRAAEFDAEVAGCMSAAAADAAEDKASGFANFCCAVPPHNVLNSHKGGLCLMALRRPLDVGQAAIGLGRQGRPLLLRFKSSSSRDKADRLLA
jgi:hypothetical protein